MKTHIKVLFWLSGLLAGTALAQTPVITAGPSADVKPGVLNAPVTFTVTASSPDGSPLTYLWAFGDGTTQEGATVTHTYATAGVYYVYATVKDAQGLKTFAYMTEPVMATAGPFLLCGFTSGKGKINLKKLHQDSLKLSGFIAQPPSGTSAAGQTVTFNLAGQITTFEVNSHGQGKNATGSTIKFMKPLKNGAIPFQVSLKNQNFFLNLIKAGYNPNQKAWDASSKNVFQQITLEVGITWGGTAATSSERDTGSPPVFGQIYLNMTQPKPPDPQSDPFKGLPDIPDPGDMDWPPLDPLDLPPDLDLPDPFDDLPFPPDDFPAPPDLPDPFDDINDLPFPDIDLPGISPDDPFDTPLSDLEF